MEGSGRMLVTAVGVNSQTGIIMTLLGSVKNNDNNNKTNAVASEQQANGVKYENRKSISGSI